MLPRLAASFKETLWTSKEMRLFRNPLSLRKGGRKLVLIAKPRSLGETLSTSETSQLQALSEKSKLACQWFRQLMNYSNKYYLKTLLSQRSSTLFGVIKSLVFRSINLGLTEWISLQQNVLSNTPRNGEQLTMRKADLYWNSLHTSMGTHTLSSFPSFNY